jgi:hypothetical protein
MPLLRNLDLHRGSERDRGAVDPRAAATALGAARLAIGVLFLVRTTPLFRIFHSAGSGEALLQGLPDAYWHGTPTIALPALVVASLCVARTIAAALFTLGLRPRVSGLVAGGAGYLVLLQRPFAFVSTLHLLFEATLLLSLTDCDAALTPWPRVSRAPVSGLWLMRAFVASIYLWAGLAKVRHDWLDGSTLAELHRMHWLAGRVAGAVLATDGRRVAVAVLVALGELALGPLLLVRRSRTLGLALAVGFHVAIEVIGRADLFGYEMLALLVVFLPGASPRASK